MRRPRVVIVGGGFGGLAAARALRGAPVDVLLIDRHNHHTFIPLLYEVATAGLDPGDIAQPLRSILRGRRNVRFLMADVRRIDLEARRLYTDAAAVSYDYLIVAAGSRTNFFGLQEVEVHTMPMKGIVEAMALRNHVLRGFERAVVERSEDRRRQLMTVVVVGGGPTGVELAGALAELKRHVLPNDYPRLDLSPARVILLEATDRLLSAFPARLQRRALDQLRELGVEVRLSTSVASVTAEGVATSDGTFIAAHTVAWVAGVRGELLGERMGLPVQRDGRVPVESSLTVPGRHDTYVIGDLASLLGPDGKPYPMLAPVAIQQGRLAAQNILRHIEGRPPTSFRYRDRGIMATIGRRKAVAHVFGLQLSGFIAWFMWLTVHLLQIVGLRNRALVLLNWIWNYVRYDRANRLVTDEPEPDR